MREQATTMTHFEQTNATAWTAKQRGQVVGTITEIEHGYDARHADGYRWTYETLDAAQASFLTEE